jgi:starch synthase (maltosyl-transferring)
MEVREGRRRVVISGVTPEVDCGRFPVKRTVGESVDVEADVFADGHDAVAVVLRSRAEDETAWREVPMRPLPNDRWRGSFRIERLVGYRYAVRGWIDGFATWRRDLAKRVEAEQDVSADLLMGAELVETAVGRAAGADRRALRRAVAALRGGDEAAVRTGLSGELAALMASAPDRRLATTYERELVVAADRKRAKFSSWYELFPRSAADEPGRHGTLADAEKLLPSISDMGFDVLYLAPIHPIGRTFRKGRNNAEQAARGDVGSPWAIGSEEGGHTAIHPDLGTLEDFDRLVASAGELGLEIAMDLAYQCSPDHPWVREHPEWFRHRPDGSIQYAENPPKKYQDIYPLDFETPDWRGLWDGLRSVVDFWIGHGVRIFRVDNPHTKAFPFWEWLIGEVRREHPDVIFLAEAFTRPKVMYRLAKLGFTQSYTYFAWRSTKWELMQYFTELTRTEVAEYFRPNLWPNTPDILTEQLQIGGRPVFLTRLVLAATLGASYGIYGPAFELMEHRAVAPGREEYLDSEKYEIRQWDRGRPDSLAELMARVNRIRRENPALHQDRTLRFHEIDNDQLIAYSKSSDDGANTILVVVNLDPHHVQSGWMELPLEELGIDPSTGFQVHDLLGEARYLWHGPRNFVELSPHVLPAHVFRVRHRVRTEADFEYFL